MSVQYSSALGTPISRQNLIFYSFVFLFRVMSLSIRRVDSLILMGRLGSRERERDELEC